MSKFDEAKVFDHRDTDQAYSGSVEEALIEWMSEYDCNEDFECDSDDDHECMARYALHEGSVEIQAYESRPMDLGRYARGLAETLEDKLHGEYMCTEDPLGGVTLDEVAQAIAAALRPLASRMVQHADEVARRAYTAAEVEAIMCAGDDETAATWRMAFAKAHAAEKGGE